MKIVHAALVCESPENAKRFYEDLLGLKMIGTKTVSADLMRRLFGVDASYTILNFADEFCWMEVFIGPGIRPDAAGIEHLCLHVGERNPFLEKCRRSGVKMLEVPKPDGTFLVFIEDFDGNRFEIKGD